MKVAQKRRRRPLRCRPRPSRCAARTQTIGSMQAIGGELSDLLGASNC